MDFGWKTFIESYQHLKPPSLCIAQGLTSVACAASQSSFMSPMQITFNMWATSKIQILVFTSDLASIYRDAARKSARGVSKEQYPKTNISELEGYTVYMRANKQNENYACRMC